VYSQFSSVWYSDLLQLVQMNLGDYTEVSQIAPSSHCCTNSLSATSKSVF